MKNKTNIQFGKVKKSKKLLQLYSKLFNFFLNVV